MDGVFPAVSFDTIPFVENILKVSSVKERLKVSHKKFRCIPEKE
jgi:hypothetical protein